MMGSSGWSAELSLVYYIGKLELGKKAHFISISSPHLFSLLSMVCKMLVTQL